MHDSNHDVGLSNRLHDPISTTAGASSFFLIIKPLCKLQSYPSFSDKPMHYIILLVFVGYLSTYFSVYPLLYPVFASVPAWYSQCIPTKLFVQSPIKLLYLHEARISSRPHIVGYNPPWTFEKTWFTRTGPAPMGSSWARPEFAMENGHGNTREIIHTWLTVHGYVELPEGSGGYSFVFFLFNL